MKIKTRLVLILAGLISLSFSAEKSIETQLEINDFKNRIPERFHVITYEMSRLSNTVIDETEPSKIRKIASDYITLFNERERIYNNYPEIKEAADYLSIHPTNYDVASVFGGGLVGGLAVAYGVLGFAADAKKRRLEINLKSNNS